jgi:hypothetical protein
MNALTEWLENVAFTAPYFEVALGTVGWFVLIYAVIAGGAWLLVVRGPHVEDVRSADGRCQRMRPRQVREELGLSLASILMFAAQAITA